MAGNAYEQTDLLMRASKGDFKARDELIKNNIPLVWSIVKRFTNRGYESDDLFQIGCLGLIKAINKFDMSYEVRFSTYAVPMIMGEIKRFMRDDGPVKISRSVKELAVKAKTISEMMAKRDGVMPAMSELAAITEASEEDIVFALEASLPPESLYASDDNISPLIEKTPDKSHSEASIVDRLSIEGALSQLSAREKRIITMRYFEGKTQSEIAEVLDISQVQVSRLEKKILCEMKKELSEV